MQDISKKIKDDAMRNQKFVKDLIRSNREADFKNAVDAAEKSVDAKLKT